MPEQRKGVRAGFTLVEVMMAATILVVGFIGLIQAVTIGSETMDTARRQQIAAQLVAAEIDRLRTSPWSTIANLPATATITVDNTGAASGNDASFALCNFTTTPADDNTALLALARGFTITYTRTRLRPGGASAGTVTFLKLAYTVTWTSNTGRSYSRYTETYLGMNGLHLSNQRS
jgi:prepilin-type N-terminal cleavage/methylation domain-containing protein